MKEDYGVSCGLKRCAIVNCCGVGMGKHGMSGPGSQGSSAEISVVTRVHGDTQTFLSRKIAKRV